jgi:hypothetical protein
MASIGCSISSLKCKNTEACVFPEPTPDRAQNGSPAQALPSAERSIFRSEARQRYVENQEKVVLPRLASPRVFVYLWILALLLMMAGSLIAFWPLIGRLW